MEPKESSASSSRRRLVTGVGSALLGSALPVATESGIPAPAHAETRPGQERDGAGAFDRAYIEGAVEPFTRRRIYAGERLPLPMIELAFGKEAAIPQHLWGMAYDGWRPNMQEEGLSVFLQGYENRGPDNARKRIYASALTPDLYRPMYAAKMGAFLDRLFDRRNAGQPLMRCYYAQYFDLYWDLHLGVTGDAIPFEVRQFGNSFNAVIGHWDPRLPVVHENYMRVRALREPLRAWIDARVQDVIDGMVARPESTFVHYWLRNGQQSENFRRKDIVFECLHNFLAFSQWGNALYNIMARLDRGGGDPAVKSWFRRTMAGTPDEADGSAFTPLDRLVMELFRIISPNTGSLSALNPTRERGGSDPSFILHSHPQTSRDPRHWADPDDFNPDRYLMARTSTQVDEARCQDTGFARCPFRVSSAPVRDGRDATMTNSGFGTVYAVVGGRHHPVVDHAGYAPFGFGYRRCAGELLTVDVFKDVLRKVWRDDIAFARLSLDGPERLPVGPGTTISDDVGFSKAR
jgi:cytochrome P450